MTSQHESSHARNIAALRAARATNISIGADRYKPVKTIIQNDELLAYCDACDAVLTRVHSGELDFETATDARQAAFEGIEKYGTRIVNTLEACGAPAGAVETARGYVGKLRGERLHKPEPASSDAPAGDIQQQISVSQKSYDGRSANFRKLVELCQHERSFYTPNEDDVSLPAIESRLQQLTTSNQKVQDTAALYSGALVERDRLLYHKETGLVARMEAIRAYYVSAYGADSAERKRLNGLSVRTLRNERLAEA
ncbi:MAG: hypothetical protein EOP50_04835 [Sphingobacteriales bacterium]|nr:MAG: hypothetical protein EOP50_04835 [Sphingobacteriales bacterium]